MTDLNQAYVGKRNAADAELKKSILDRWDAEVKQTEQPTPAPAAPAAAPTEKPKEQGMLGRVWDNVSSVPGQALGGALDAVKETWKSIDDAAEWLNDNVIDLRYNTSILPGREQVTKATENLSKAIPKSDTVMGDMTRAVSQFLLPYSGVLKGMRAATGIQATGRAAMAAESAVAAGATAAVAFDPHEQRASNMIMELAPSLRNPVLEYLAANPADSKAEGRFKSALENAGLGLMVDGMFGAMAATKKYFSSKGQNPAESVQQAWEQNIKQADGKGTQQVIDEKTGAAAKPMDADAQAAKQAELTDTFNVSDKEMADFWQRQGEITHDLRSMDEAAANKLAADAREAASPIAIERVRMGQPMDDASRAAIMQDIKETVEQAIKKDDKVLTDAGVRNPDGTVDLAKYMAWKGQAGNVNPEFAQWLAKGIFGGDKASAAGSTLGGVTGWNAADPEAPLKDKALLALAGAVTGRYAAKGLKGSMRDGIKAASDNAEQVIHKAKNPLTHSLPAGISPVVKKPLNVAPKLDSVKVTQLTDALLSGNTKKLADAVDPADFNLAHIDSDEALDDLINATSKVFEKEINTSKRGVQTHAQTEALAREIGVSSKGLASLYKDTAGLDAKFLAYRNLMAASGKRVVELARLADSAVAADADVAALELRKAVMLHSNIQAKVKGIQTEVARTMSAMRIRSSADHLVRDEMDQLLAGLGGRTTNKEFVQKVLQLADDPAKLNHFARKSSLARTTDVIREYYINALLSSPITHMANTIGNSIVAIGGVTERFVAGGIGSVRGLLFRSNDTAKVSDAVGYLFGMKEGFKAAVGITDQGFKFGNGLVAQSFKKDMPITDTSAQFMEKAGEYAISAQHFGMDGFAGKAVDYLGTAVRLPGRFLTAEDELFKGINYRGELSRQAYMTARREGLSGDAFNTRVADILSNPEANPSVRDAAINAAREATFTKPLGEAGARLTAAIDAMNVAGLPLGRIVIPFIKTPTNILKYTYERMPGTMLLHKSVRDAIHAGGPEADLILAKQATGAMYLTLGAYLVSEGKITGGFISEKSKGAENLAGVPQYSIKVGDTYYAYNRLDPIGMFLGMVADYSEVSTHLKEHEQESLATAIVMTLGKQLESKSYLQGINNFLQTFHAASTDDQAKLVKGMSQMAGAVVPAGVAGVVRMNDPQVYEVYEWMDGIKARTAQTEGMYPKRNLFGEPVDYKHGWGPDIASPIYTADISSASVGAKEVARLNVDLRHPPKRIDGVDLTAKQYDRLMVLLGKEVKLGGMNFKEYLDSMVKGSEWKSFPERQGDYDGSKELRIKQTYAQFREVATKMLLQEDPELQSRFFANKMNKSRAVAGSPIEKLQKVKPYD